MKLNNELLVIDLETTAGQDAQGNQTNNDIIQIGAVLLDKSLGVLSRWDSLVAPREVVTEYITKLTGITDEAAQAARPFPEVVREMEAWVRNWVPNIKNVRFCAHGTYFDIPILRRLYREYSITYPYSGTAFDTKTWAALWMSLQDRRTDKLSVSHIASVMGLTPSGAYHNAAIDADMEARIVQRIFSDLDGGMFLEGKLLGVKQVR